MLPRFTYAHDFGSTTTLQLDLRGARRGRIGRQAVRLLTRNAPLVWPCAFCAQGILVALRGAIFFDLRGSAALCFRLLPESGG